MHTQTRAILGIFSPWCPLQQLQIPPRQVQLLRTNRWTEMQTGIITPRKANSSSNIANFKFLEAGITILVQGSFSRLSWEIGSEQVWGRACKCCARRTKRCLSLSNPSVTPPSPTTPPRERHRVASSHPAGLYQAEAIAKPQRVCK